MRQDAADPPGTQPTPDCCRVAAAPDHLSLREDNVHVVVEMNEQIMSHHIISIFCVRPGKYLDFYFQSFKVHNFNITLSV